MKRFVENDFAGTLVHGVDVGQYTRCGIYTKHYNNDIVVDDDLVITCLRCAQGGFEVEPRTPSAYPRRPSARR